MANPPLTLTLIAKQLGVSTTAVSLAMRGRKGVSEDLRRRIVAFAEQNDYQPNPVAIELMTWVRAQREANRDSSPVAFVTTFSDPSLIETIPTYAAFLKGAVNKGQDYGYHVEVFHACAPGMTCARLDQILKARGVRGVLVGPNWQHETFRLDLDWTFFSSVLIGEVYLTPGIHRVANHHALSCRLALEQLAARGYKHIGVALNTLSERRRRFDFALGIDQFLYHDQTSAKVGVHDYETWDAKAFATWTRAEGVDVVVSLDPGVWDTVKTLRLHNGEPMGYACLDASATSGFSGIFQHPEIVGETGMTLLRQLLLAGERGTALHPRIVLLDGTWIEGSTTRKTAPAESKTSAARTARARSKV